MNMSTKPDTNTAIQTASGEAIDLVYRLGNDEIHIPSDLSDRDINMIQYALTTVVLGTTSISQVVDELLTEIEADEDVVLEYIKSVFTPEPTSLKKEICNFPINSSALIEDVRLIDEEVVEKEQTPTNSISSVLAGTSDQISRESVLHEIENPQETVKKTEYVFPRTKPSTSDILKRVSGEVSGEVNTASAPLPQTKTTDTSIASTEHTDAANSADTTPVLFDPYKQKQIENQENETPHIIDPFKNTEKQPEKQIQTATPSILQPIAEIQHNLNKKLNSITGTSVKESFKSHDPYREPITK